ncbi:hypothetical protein EVAR_85115_1 [Eumeta japonica]|uniref:RNase H type-1 domain-containing protein n=1 Tax=Eumeta variegata TaxID=151549 RepID=A0A4C1XUG7_EUMVA|nr:hypothetical protein EVAR_85115_1 [Eumeta japonica]
MPRLPKGLYPFRAGSLETYSPTGSSRVSWICVNCRFPAHVLVLGLESVENLDPTTMDRLAIIGPHIYTDGSRIEGRVRVALTGWRDGVESGNSAHRLEPFCIVFQAEFLALHRAIKRAHAARRNIVNIVAEGRMVRTFWVRVFAEITANERADELARNAALKMVADYDRFPLSFTKKAIKGMNLEEWQKKYSEDSTCEIIKCFFPRAKETYRIFSRVQMTPSRDSANLLSTYTGSS